MVAARRGPLALALLMAHVLGGCALSTSAGMTSALPGEDGLGGGVRASGWIDEVSSARLSEVRPIVGAELGLDSGPFGWRMNISALGGFAYGGDPVLLYGFLGLAPVALGHLARDRDPDPWFGVSGEAALGVALTVDGYRDGTFVGVRGSVFHDVAYSGPGAETYAAVLLTVGLHFDISFRMF